jgi:purine-binding chemotaxis protein CheW
MVNHELELRAEVDALRGRLAQLEARLKKTYARTDLSGRDTAVLLVDVGSLKSALELERVQEVVPAATLSPLPEAPDWVLGTLNLRGKSVPVVHVAHRLDGAAKTLSVSDLIVIVATPSGTAGLVVSQVGAVKVIRSHDDTSMLETPHAPYVVGSFNDGTVARLILGVSELFRHTELSLAVQEADAAGSSR